MGSWLTEHHDLFMTALRVIGVVVLAVVLRFALARVVDTMARRAARVDRPRRVLGSSRAAQLVSSAAPWHNERQKQRADAMASLLKSVATVVIAVVAVFMVMDLLGYNLAPLIASAGIAGVALGFGAQNLVKDFLAGVCMLLEDQYGVGDVVDLEQASGTVEAVGLRVTRLRDATGVIWYVRNGEVLRVGNRSQGFSQISLDVQIAYDEDVQKATDLTNTVAATVSGEPRFADIVIDAPTVVGVDSVTGTAVTLKVLGTCASNQQFGIQRELRRAIKDAFDQNGIRVPPPTPWLTPGAGGTP